MQVRGEGDVSVPGLQETALQGRVALQGEGLLQALPRSGG